MRDSLKLKHYLKPYWLSVLLAPLLMMVEVGMDLLQPHLIQQIIDQGITAKNMSVVYRLGPEMILIAVFGLIGGIGCTVFSVLASQGFGTDIRNAMFSRVQSFSFRNLDELETGKLVTRLTNDVWQMQETVLIMLRMMVRAPLMHVGSLIMAIVTAPQLAWLYLVLLPLEFLVIIVIVRKAFPLFSKVQQKLDTLNTTVQENLSGVRVIKAFVRENFEIKRFRRANNDLTDQNIQAVRTVAVVMPFMMMTMNVGLVGALWFGGINVNVGNMQVGQIVAFVNYLTMTLMSLMMLSMVVMRISRAEASAVRINEVLDMEPVIKNSPNANGNGVVDGLIEFDNVTFSYAEHDEEPVLSNLSFSAEPGETVAIMGATGSGKTSLVHLIPRYYDVDGGRIMVDHMDVRDMDQSTLRRRVGIAMQEAVLFSGTIRDNIRYGRPDATDEEVVAAAKIAQAHDFIVGFPDGYEAMVGQRGVNLSGGQKQRIAIARALLTQPAILILDDSTSAVDVATEARIQQALAQPEQRRTRIIVAQRISSVMGADKIIVLENGQISAQGTHEELLRTSEVYREIYESQIGAQLEWQQEDAINSASAGDAESKQFRKGDVENVNGHDDAGSIGGTPNATAK